MMNVSIRKMGRSFTVIILALMFMIICASVAFSQSSHPYLNMPYSVNPSFSVSIPYDLSLYEDMPGYLARFGRCEADLQCVLDAVYAIEKERPDLNWVVSYGGNIISSTWGIVLFPEDYVWASYCEEPDQRAIDSIAEAIDTCAHAPDKDCVCPYRTAVLPHTEKSADLDEDLAAFETLFGINRFTYDFGEEGTDIFNTVVFKEEGKNLRVSLEGSSATAQLVKDVLFKTVSKDLPGAPDKLKYERRGTGKQLFIYKDPYGNISILPEKPEDDSRECRVQDRVLKFCVVQNQSFFAYNDVQKRMGIQQLVLKFAYLFKGEITDVGAFEVRDARLASNTSLLTWNPLLGVNVDHYTIYYSKDPAMKTNLKDKSPDQLDPAIKEKLNTLILPVKDKQDIHISIDSVLDPKCIIDRINCTKRYNLLSVLGIDITSTELKNDTLYYSTADEHFFYLMSNISNDALYMFAITATDTEGKESPSFNFPDPGSYEPSKDDLPPGLADLLSVVQQGDQFLFTIRNISYSIDGSPTAPDSITDYKIYCFSQDISGQVNLSETPALFAEDVQRMEDGTVQFTKYVSDFDSFNCGFLTQPYIASFVIAGVEKTSRGEDISYQGNVTDKAFSYMTANIPPDMIGEDVIE
jgi:hypothetical protein